MPQINVLLRLYYSGPSTILQLRSDSVGSRAAASQMIDDLVKRGYVERSESNSDRRIKKVTLTAEGRMLVEHGIAARRRWLIDLADSFSTGEKEDISRVLTMMVEKINELEGSQNAVHNDLEQEISDAPQ